MLSCAHYEIRDPSEVLSERQDRVRMRPRISGRFHRAGDSCGVVRELPSVLYRQTEDCGLGSPCGKIYWSHEGESGKGRDGGRQKDQAGKARGAEGREKNQDIRADRGDGILEYSRRLRFDVWM